MQVDDLVAFINEFTPALPSVNMPLTRDLALYAGALGMSAYRNRARSARPLPVIPTSAVDFNSARLAALSRAVQRYKPAIERTIINSSINHGVGATYLDVTVTANMLTNTDFMSKVLGDKFRNLGLKLNMNVPSSGVGLNRIIIYRPMITGVGLGSTAVGFDTIIDTAKFKVLYDRTRYMDTALTTIRHNQIRIWVPLKGFISRFDRTSATAGTIQTNELRIYILTSASAATTSQYQYELTFQNK